MPTPPPSRSQLAAISSRFGFQLTSAELHEFAPEVAATLISADIVEELHSQSVPAPMTRSASCPTADQNRFGAWARLTSINESSSGPLVGKTVAIKDNVAVAGVPMANGSRSVDGYVPRSDATVVRRLLEAGATIKGKATCEDLCFSGSSFTSHSGPVHNPWDSSKSSGGSSSGSGVLVAIEEVDFAIGGDQGGSIRIPSSFLGTVGHKPTYGLVPYTGAFPIENTIDHLGPMARTVSDIARLLNVIAGVDGYDSRQPSSIDSVDYLTASETPAAGLRVGVVREGFGTTVSEPAVDDAVRQAVDLLSSEGVTVSDVSIPWHLNGVHVWNVIATEGAAFQMLNGNAYGMNFAGLYDPELMQHFARERVAHGESLSKTVKLVGLSGQYTFEARGGSLYGMARNLSYELRSGYDRALEDYDVLVMPTTPYRAQSLPTPDAPLAEYITAALSMVVNTAPFNVTGHPACSVPAGLVDGLPVGMMIVGRRFDDATVLRIARTFEKIVGGFQRPPTDFKPVQEG